MDGDGLNNTEDTNLLPEVKSIDHTPVYEEESLSKNQSSFKLYFWQIVTFICVALGVTSVYCSWALLSVSFDLLINDPKIVFNKERSGYIISAGIGIYLLGKLILGYYTDVVGGKWAMLSTQMIIVGASVGFGFSYNFGLMVFFWSLMKFAQSCSWMAMTKIVGNWFPKKVIGRVYGLLSSCGSLGDFLGRIGLGLLLKSFATLSWRHSFWICAILIVIIVAITAYPLKDSPSDVNLYVDTKEEVLEDEEEKIHDLNDKGIFAAILYFAISPRVYLMLLAQTSMTALFSFNEEYVPLYLAEVYKLDSGDAALYSSVCSLSAVIGVFVGGFIYDLLINYPITKIIYLLCGSVLSTGCMIAVAVFGVEIPFPFALTIFGFSFFVLAPPYYLCQGVFAISFGGPYSAFLIGVTDGGSYLGSMLFGMFAGKIIEQSWRLFYAFVAGFGVIGFVTLCGFLILDYFMEKKSSKQSMEVN
eukprot:gene1517-12643_t